jgi:hypothetical protein
VIFRPELLLSMRQMVSRFCSVSHVSPPQAGSKSKIVTPSDEIVNRDTGFYSSECNAAWSISGTVLLVFGLLVPNVLQAARIDGPANMRERPEGRAIVMLADRVYVDCDCEPPTDEWYLIGIQYRLSSDAGNSPFVEKGEVLYDLEGREIGRALESFPVERHWRTREGQRYGEIPGYTHRKNIRAESLLEAGFVSLVDAPDEAARPSRLATHIRELRYRPWIDRGVFKTYAYSDPWMVTETPGLRSILVRHGDRLVAIIYPKAYLKTQFANAKPFLQGMWIVYVAELEPSIAAELETIYRGILETAG